MSQQNIDVVRGANDDWNRRDRRAWMLKHHADMVAVPHRDWPEPQPLEGCEAWFHQVRQMLEPWDEQRLEIDDVHTAGPIVVLIFRWVARGRHTQIDIDLPLAGNYTVSDGKIERIEFFFDASEPLEAAGLHEVALSQKHIEGTHTSAGALKVFEAEILGGREPPNSNPRRPATMHAVPVIALIDGEHHPSAVRDALARLDLAGVVFCGGEEKLGSGSLEDHYGMPVESEPEEALRRLAPRADAVLDLADEPVVPASRKLRLAALALDLGLAYETPGARLEPPRYEPVGFHGPKLAVIATGKRTGKTAVAGHWAALLRESGVDPVIVCMGRGGPPEPKLAEAAPSLDELIAIAENGSHAASDYLEDAVIARVPTVGCRRVGGGLAGAPFESNVPEGAALAASLEPDAIVFEGSGACIPPVETDRTVCILGAGRPEPFAEYRLARADLVLAAEGAVEPPPEAVPFSLRPEPLEQIPRDARVAVFTTGATEVEGISDPVLFSTDLARRRVLAGELDRAAERGADIYLTELKAAAIDTVTLRARAEGARVVFIRNRPVGIDDALVKLYRDAVRK